MLKNSSLSKSFLYITLFITIRIFFLLSMIFIVMKESEITISGYYITHYKIFLCAVGIYIIDYVVSFVINLRENLFGNKTDFNIFGFLSLILFITIFLSSIYNTTPEDLIKTSAIIILFLIIKYSSNPKIRYNL
ncbi:hypothetical protein KA977_05595 [Candidatus Dependentiae bacterium]|nr:hypothetical protein [Candidatus Dependentiae bacterium]